MIKILFGLFIILHGLVHILYFGQSARYFELQPGMLWPDGSWALSKLLTGGVNRTLASIMLLLAAIGLITSGIGILAEQSWWRFAVAGSAVFSSLLFILFWDGLAQHLDAKGAVGLLINAAILVCVLLFHWPDFEF